MNATLRAATSSDAECIAEVLLASRATFLPYARLAHTDGEVRTWVRAVLLSSESVTVAVVKSQVIGVLALAQHDGISWLTQLYLHPAHVAQGIGSKLLAYAIATALPPIRLYTFQQNVGARRFYERNGFVPTEFTNGSANEEQCPDVLYELASPRFKNRSTS